MSEDNLGIKIIAVVAAAVIGISYHGEAVSKSYDDGYSSGYSEASHEAEVKIEESAQEWYNEGYNEGYDDGYATVYDQEVFEKEFADYWEVARSEGKEEGIAETKTEWQQKLAESNADWEKKVSESYKNGYNSGYSQGKNDGYNSGYNAGYAAAPKTTTTSAVKQPSYLTSSQSMTVYITQTGSKYHRYGCSYLKSKIAITLSNAIAQGYTACSRCF